MLHLVVAKRERLKVQNVHTIAQSKAKTAERISKYNGLSCPELRCTRVYITEIRLLEHVERGKHTDGINRFRAGPSTDRSTVSFFDFTRDKVIELLNEWH